jgi:hypothetical protein
MLGSGSEVLEGCVAPTVAGDSVILVETLVSSSPRVLEVSLGLGLASVEFSIFSPAEVETVTSAEGLDGTSTPPAITPSAVIALAAMPAIASFQGLCDIKDFELLFLESSFKPRGESLVSKMGPCGAELSSEPGDSGAREYRFTSGFSA